MYKAKLPRFSTPDGTAIDVLWDHPEHGEIPFTATPVDVTDYGREIYHLALAGEFGEVAPYDGPSEEEILASNARAHRDALLADLDAIVINPLRWAEFSEQEKQNIAVYRQSLLDVPQQSGFPTQIVWPEPLPFLV